METERNFDPKTMARATPEDIRRIYRQLWGTDLPAQEADMLYNGYTESETMKNARAERLFTDYKTNFQLTHTSEQTADDLAALVDVVNASAPLDIDTVDAVRWQDTPEIKEANQASDKFNYDAVKETEF
jgi:hypothetical protein